MAERTGDVSPATEGRPYRVVEVFTSGSFDPLEHYYPRVLNAQIHPLVRSFLNLGNERIAKRYIHLHPEASSEAVQKALAYHARYFQWGGADLFVVTSEGGHKRFVVVETNSCPSGQKSMPTMNEDEEQSGYRKLLERSLLPHIRAGQFNGQTLPQGVLAVLYDKNKMEASGYAAVLADLTDERVFLVPYFEEDIDNGNAKARFRADGVLEINVAGARPKVHHEKSATNFGDGTSVVASVSRTGPKRTSRAAGEEANELSAAQISPPDNGPESPAKQSLMPEAPPKKEEDSIEWVPVRAACRYVTQRPWNRFPPVTRTLIFNPVLACLAGGRNKAVAAKAYDLHNADLGSTGLSILTPETIWDVAKPEVPLWVGRMGGLAVVKVPYANAGQGVWTITNEEELREFMSVQHHYDRFIVQALVGNFGWSSQSTSGRLYHVGTVPSSKGNIFAADLRVMVGSCASGFFPVAIYARRARVPLCEHLGGQGGASSWDMLGTNLSYKKENGTWGTETDRLLLMDSRDFNRLGVGMDDLIESYMQTILAVTAIDRLACKLITPKGNFGNKLFQSLNPDPKLLAELYRTQLSPPMQPPQPPLNTGLQGGSTKGSYQGAAGTLATVAEGSNAKGGTADSVSSITHVAAAAAGPTSPADGGQAQSGGKAQSGGNDDASVADEEEENSLAVELELRVQGASQPSKRPRIGRR